MKVDKVNNKGLLENKVCLVTGAGSGIGKAIAQKYSSEGAIVYANDFIVDSVDCWIHEISIKQPGKVIPMYFDICNSKELKNAIQTIMGKHARIDVLVNNAGIVSYEFIPSIVKDNLRTMFEVNVFALIELLQLTSRIMMRCQRGSIINIASIVGVNGVAGQLAYSASKGAVISITKSAAKELARHQIRVNAIAPGMVATDRLKKIAEQRFPEKIASIGLGRMAEPEEIANLCLFLGSDLSEYITGQVICADGSMVL
jgi:3-oxoacyl-[acyl-carrier protein] reductase